MPMRYVLGDHVFGVFAFDLGVEVFALARSFEQAFELPLGDAGVLNHAHGPTLKGNLEQFLFRIIRYGFDERAFDFLTFH